MEDLHLQQQDRYELGKWREAYKHFSSTFQGHCPYDEFLSSANQYEPSEYRAIEYEDWEVEIDGDVAYVTYFVTYNGEETGTAATSASPDIYVKIDGEWYDEYDEWTTC